MGDRTSLISLKVGKIRIRIGIIIKKMKIIKITILIMTRIRKKNIIK